MNDRKLRMMGVAASLLCIAATLYAQDITGSWQGTIDSGSKLRVILQIEKTADGTFKGTAYSIDQSPNPTPVTTLSFTNPMLKFTVDPFHASYEGTLSPDGKTHLHGMSDESIFHAVSFVARSKTSRLALP